MPDLSARIKALSPTQGARILNAITRASVNRGTAIDVTPDAALVKDLAASAGTLPDAGASAADVAQVALLLLADDPAMTAVLDRLIENPPAEEFAVDPLTLGIGAAALIVLQSYIKFERDKAGKWTFKFEKQPMSDSLLKQLIGKLGGWLRGG